MATCLYLATGKGVVTVKNGSGPWAVAQESLKDWDVSEVAVDPRSPNRLFAGTRGDGVWVSEDGGATWTRPNRGRPGPGKVKCVTVDPHNSNRIYAGTEPIAIWVSEDSGKSWRELKAVWDVPEVAEVDYPVYAVEPHTRDITIDPKDPKTIYAALQVGHIIKSTDGGESWKILNKGVDADVHTIVIHPEDTSHIYVATGGHDNRLGNVPGRALYESLDGGLTWRPMAMEFEQEYSVPLVMHPQNPKVLFSALADGQPNRWRSREEGALATIIRSEDGGSTWHPVETGLPQVSKDYVEAIAMDPGQPERIFIATRKGELFSSPDGGATWSALGVQVGSVSDMKGANV